jgi:putative transposase
MGRPLRLQLAGAIYHVTARGNRRQEIFLDDEDRERFLNVLAAVVERHAWRCHAYCLMPNHYHAVIETKYADLSAGMHRLNSGYAKWFNQRHEVDGHLFQNRFHAVLLESTVHLLELVRYVSLNPVRAGLCDDPGGWAWSSYRPMAGIDPARSFLTVDWFLRYFGKEPARARGRFIEFVRDVRDAAAA